MAGFRVKIRPLRVGQKPRRMPENRKPAYSSGFYADLPPRPETPDLVQARLYWMRICELLDDPTKMYKRNERTTLRRLKETWRRRAFGEDHRWLLVGGKPGRLERGLEAAVRPEPRPGWGEQFAIARPENAE